MTLPNIYHYILGHYRYKLYYSRFFKWLIRRHIREQIGYRLRSMDKQCYQQGTCKLCGCQTTQLQMANKACDKPCYPIMLDSFDWHLVKQGYSFKNEGYVWTLVGNKFQKTKA